jgi:DNA-binding FadR family transcriptional regulator
MKSAASLRDELRRIITSGSLRPGERLPTERELSSTFGVARNTVRRALDDLSRSGLIARHIGRGTFVAGGAPLGRAHMLFNDPAVAAGALDVIEARLALEPALVELVLQRATDEDFEELEDILKRADNVTDWREFESYDARFHRAVAELASNKMLLNIADDLARIRLEPGWADVKARTLDAKRRGEIQAAHYRILDGLRSRDADRAREAVRAHLLDVREHFFAAEAS